jgi:hypothetical protein
MYRRCNDFDGEGPAAPASRRGSTGECSSTSGALKVRSHPRCGEMAPRNAAEKATLAEVSAAMGMQVERPTLSNAVRVERTDSRPRESRPQWVAGPVGCICRRHEAVSWTAGQGSPRAKVPFAGIASLRCQRRSLLRSLAAMPDRARLPDRRQSFRLAARVAVAVSTSSVRKNAAKKA